MLALTVKFLFAGDARLAVNPNLSELFYTCRKLAERMDLAPPQKKQQTSTSAAGDPSSFAGLAAHLPIGVLLLDSDEQILYANAACDHLLPMRSETLAGANILDFVHTEDREAFRFHLARQRLSSRPVPGFEARFRRPDGPDLWMLANITPGRSMGIAAETVLTLTDIDQRKRAELERRVWEERWNSALVSSTLGVWDHDFKNGTMYYSDTWKLIRGLAPDEDVEAATEDWIQAVHPDATEWQKTKKSCHFRSARFAAPFEGIAGWADGREPTMSRGLREGRQSASKPDAQALANRQNACERSRADLSRRRERQ